MLSSPKPTPTIRSERLDIRMTADQKELLLRATELQGRSMSDFVMENLLDAAHRVIEEAQIMRLSARDSLAFAEALLQPAKPNEKLRAAAKRYKQRIGRP